MNCVILQPSYIPWRGYFDQIHRADVFVFYDDVQYDKHGWRNRNRVKTPTGSQWLTIPVFTKGATTQHLLINEVRIDQGAHWERKHWTTLAQSYGKAPYWSRYAPLLQGFFASQPRPERLADFTIDLTVAIAHALGIEHTRFIRSSSLEASGTKTRRLIEILQRLGATHYISGPAARDYIEEEQFRAAGIGLEYMTYEYPEYPQMYPPFDPQVSILDLLFMTGPDAPRYIWE
jgi:hypothetical protein